MPRRSVRGRTRSRQYGEPVYTWAFRSSQARGGQVITYETRLEEDGKLRCNCPGWIFCKIAKDGAGNAVGDKTCKHTNMVKEEAPDILRRFRRGEELSTFVDPAIADAINAQGITTGRMRSDRPNISNPPRTLSEAEARTGSALRRGRVIQLD